VAGGEGVQAQQHQRPYDLALDLGAGTGGVRPHQRTLELRPGVGGDVPGGERTEAGGDAVRRIRAGGQLLDPRAGGGHRRDRRIGE
jgi:hypothetical protein